MNYFNKYTSNTIAGSGNQLCFSTDGNKITSRVYYKISAGGTYNYSILFSNIIDSTFNDGLLCHKNFVIDEWFIHSARIGKCKSFPKGEIEALQPERDIVTTDFVQLTFDQKYEKTVSPGGFFASDPIQYDFMKDEYLCLELTYSGEHIPYHYETILPVYTNNGEEWKYTNLMPLASMIGCDRKVKSRIAFMGDSITQGCGTAKNGYEHWNACLADKLGEDYAYWNLGLGYGRADDAASDGAWLYRAKQNDIVFVCYGVNDIIQGFTNLTKSKRCPKALDT